MSSPTCNRQKLMLIVSLDDIDLIGRKYMLIESDFVEFILARTTSCYVHDAKCKLFSYFLDYHE